MISGQIIDLFKLQKELTEANVDMACLVIRFISCTFLTTFVHSPNSP
jgi:hypothetical protein